MSLLLKISRFVAIRGQAQTYQSQLVILAGAVLRVSSPVERGTFDPSHEQQQCSFQAKRLMDLKLMEKCLVVVCQFLAGQTHLTPFYVTYHCP